MTAFCGILTSLNLLSFSNHLEGCLKFESVKQINDGKIMAIHATSCVPDAGRQGPDMLCEGQNLPLHPGPSFRCHNELSPKILPWIRFLERFLCDGSNQSNSNQSFNRISLICCL